jgi:hypothetical protein
LARNCFYLEDPPRGQVSNSIQSVCAIILGVGSSLACQLLRSFYSWPLEFCSFTVSIAWPCWVCKQFAHNKLPSAVCANHVSFRGDFMHKNKPPAIAGRRHHPLKLIVLYFGFCLSEFAWAKSMKGICCVLI